MLRELTIRNLAVLEEAKVAFAAGLNVLTGETGAGKSIVIDALLLVRGARVQADLIRTGAETASVEAVFEVPPSGPVAAVLDEAGHAPADGQLVIKRELSRSGRHRVFVNDSAATVGLLERLGDVLVEIHGQHEHQRLMEPARQLDLLDRFADCEEARLRLGERWRQWDTARSDLARIRDEAREGARKEELYRWELSEIDAVQLRDGEEDELRGERRRLQNAERIYAGLQEVMDLLQEDAQAAGARLGRAASLLRDLSRFDPDVGAPIEALEGAQAYVEDAVARARALRDRAVMDPDRLRLVDERLDAISGIKRKYGETAAAVSAYREEIARALDRIERHDAIVEETQAEVARASEAASRQGRELSETRAEAAPRLERLIQRELRTLGMDHARFRVALRREVAGAEDLASGPDGWRLGARGAESAEFLLSANPGEELKPLAKVVSGGELSRTMLAIKTILAASEDVPSMVFDEVDAGIGGRVADAVGHKLRQTAAGRQVLCVTHLAPIAAYAEHHLLVDKRVAKGATKTTVTALDAGGQVEEIARMLGGERITDASRRHARELLKAARSGE
ncbi:MAG: DNA repair protein RecN [Candidatus Rokuibacteriota bacterium]|nr:MAG: DNA repair protein RecN [Candidatus Rokubacteria bacterium]